MKWKHHLLMAVFTSLIGVAGALWFGENFRIYLLAFMLLALPFAYLVYWLMLNHLASTLRELDETTQDKILARYCKENREKVLRRLGR